MAHTLFDTFRRHMGGMPPKDAEVAFWSTGYCIMIDSLTVKLL